MDVGRRFKRPVWEGHRDWPNGGAIKTMYNVVWGGQGALGSGRRKLLLPPSRARKASKDGADVTEVGKLFHSDVVLGKKLLKMDLWKSLGWNNRSPLVRGSEFFR